MSKRNILVALGMAAALISAPAYADGKPNQTRFEGPTPLKAQPYCESGKGYYDTAGRFICPVVTRRTVPTKRTVVTKASAPVTKPSAQYDFSGFNGGVGSTIGTGYVGGGRGIIVTGGSSYSGVLSHSAAALTFQRSRGGSHGGHHCGC